MSMTTQRGFVLVLVCFLGLVAYGAQRNLRFVEKFQIPGSSETVVVAEGDFEPRSAGSYTLMVYSGRSKRFPTDDFVTGVIHRRNGRVENVKFEDVDDDGRRDIVIIIRSAGSGSYLSADAFHYGNGSLELIGSVSDLEKNTDPIQALRGKLSVPRQRQSK